jgi:putative ABC transport system permease protein
MHTLWQDVRYGLRTLSKRPGFTLIAIATLALGIGGCTAIFTVVDAALLRALPYREPERLVHLWETTPQNVFHQREASYPDYLDWQQSDSFTGMAAYSGGGGFMLEGNEAQERVDAGRVSANFLSVLGVAPILGRDFQPGEDQPGAERLVILSFSLWQRLFGGNPDAVGKSLKLSGFDYTVVGVLPKSFQFAARGSAQLWTPLQPGEAQRSRRYMHWIRTIGRLKPGVNQDQAQAEIQTIAARIEKDHGDSHAGTAIILVPLHQEFVGAIKPLLFVLLAAVGFVLLIACANVANLLLARSSARQKEVAIRLALGATRWRLMRQLLTESVLLALVGGAAGLVIAQSGVEALIAAIPEFQLSTMPYLRDLGIDRGVLGFTALLSLLTGIVFGLFPALQTSRPDLQSTLKEGGRTSSGGLRSRVRGALVVTEIALALVLLVGAGLMLQSLKRLLQVDPGFRTEDLLTFSISLPPTRYTEQPRVAAFHEQLLTRLESAPGVEGAATISTLPLIGGNTTRFFVASQPRPAPGRETEANLRDISPNYFRVMGVPLVAGRPFSESDDLNAPPVVIVNQTLARLAFSNEDPTGQRLIFTGGDPTPIEIVGVVGDEKLNGLDAAITPVVYFPFLQDGSPGVMTNVVVRTSSHPSGLTSAIRNECLALEPALAIYGVRTIEETMDNLPATFMRRYPALLIGVFSAVALVLAAVGVYGVISYSVAQQTREIGIRIALGAARGDVLRLVMRKGMTLTVSGIAVGLGAAWALTRLMSGLLFEVSATDSMTFGIVALLLAGVALTACFLPARRATKVDPMVALRYE